MRTNYLYFFSTMAQVTGAIAGFSILGFIFGAERYGGYMSQEDRDALLSGFLVLVLAITAECVVLFGDASETSLAASRGLKTVGVPALVDAIHGQAISYRLRRIPWPTILVGVIIGFSAALTAILGPMLILGSGLNAVDLGLSIVAVGLGLTLILRSLLALASPADIQVHLSWEAWTESAGAAPWRLRIALRNQSERPADNWRCRMHMPKGVEGYSSRLNGPLVTRFGVDGVELDTQQLGTLGPYDEVWLVYLEPKDQSLPDGIIRWEIQGKDVRVSFDQASLHELFKKQTGQVPS